MLFLATLVILVSGLFALFLSSVIRKDSGVPTGHVIYTDTGGWKRNDRSLFSSIHRVTGKPDYLVQTQSGIIPVEVKSGFAPKIPRDGHVLQLAAYCLLVEECMGFRPSHGIITYDDLQFKIEYTDSLQTKIIKTLKEMRQAGCKPNGPHRNHSEIQRCSMCGVRAECTEIIKS